MNKYITEFIGTFFLVLTIGLSVLGGTPMAPLAIGASLMVMVYMGGHVSGGHYNPAVSLAVLLRGKLQRRDVVPYMVMQVVGALAAAAIVYVVLGRRSRLHLQTLPRRLALCSLKCCTRPPCVWSSSTARPRHRQRGTRLRPRHWVHGPAGAFAGGPISGGAFNPAVGVGPIVVAALLGGGSLGDLWLYLLGPFSAAVWRLRFTGCNSLPRQPRKRRWRIAVQGMSL